MVGRKSLLRNPAGTRPRPTAFLGVQMVTRDWVMRDLKTFNLVQIFSLFIGLKSASAEPLAAKLEDQGDVKLERPPPGLWEEGLGQGFRSSAQTFTVEAGASQGFAILGTRQVHNFGLLSLSYSHMLGRTVAQDHFYKGNWELRGELFGGSQFSPGSDWIVGLTPHLRYNFATGSRFIPFFDLGAGVTATSIGPPDLSNTFEFNLQAAVGCNVFLSDSLALTFDARYLHLSCAGISHPNLGVNGVLGMAGLTFFF